MDAYQFSIIIAIIFAFGELLTGTFIFISFAAAMLLIATFQFFAGDFNLNRDVAAFILLSLFFVIFFRGLFRGEKDKTQLNANDDINNY